MMDRYDGLKGKENANANSRQRRLESEHASKDNFVKSVENSQSKHAGKAPNLKKEDMKFNAQMMNTGEHAQEFARSLTKGLDKVAYPLK